MSYEGYVKYADDSVVSLQCFEGRHNECPDQDGDPEVFALSGPLDGYWCECGGCLHGHQDVAA